MTEDRWIDRVRAEYAPEDWSPAERRAFEDRLEQRLQRRPRLRAVWFAPALAAAVAAALVFTWFAPADSPSASVASVASTEYDVLFAADDPNWVVAAEVDYLPADYLALSNWIDE